MHLKTKYTDEEADIQFAQYHDGSTAMLLKDAETGEPLLTATVCLSASGMKPRDGHVFIKDWSENEGTYTALLEAGVIGEAVATYETGWVAALECPLLVAIGE